MADATEKFAFWLVPSPEAKSVFARVVEDLARRLDAPLFEPHVTLSGGELEEARAIELLNEAATTCGSIQLQVTGIEFSEKYTKTLYVQFRDSAEAAALSHRIGSGVGKENGYEFNPHLSLLYTTMPEAAKAELAREIQIPFELVTCDAIKLVSVPPATKTAEDVRAWRTIAERQLATTR